VPEGDWHCELCTEKRAVGGSLARAKALLPDGLLRWRQRVRNVRCAAELALVLGRFEMALRFDELSQAAYRARRSQRSSDEQHFELGRVVGSRQGMLAREFQVEQVVKPPVCVVVLPDGVRPGQKLTCTPPNCRPVQITIPPGMAAGQKINVSVPRPLWPRTLSWCSLDALAPVEALTRVLEHEIKLEDLYRREKQKEEEVKDVLCGLVAKLEEREHQHKRPLEQLLVRTQDKQQPRQHQHHEQHLQRRREHLQREQQECSLQRRQREVQQQREREVQQHQHKYHHHSHQAQHLMQQRPQFQPQHLQQHHQLHLPQHQQPFLYRPHLREAQLSSGVLAHPAAAQQCPNSLGPPPPPSVAIAHTMQSIAPQQHGSCASWHSNAWPSGQPSASMPTPSVPSPMAMQCGIGCGLGGGVHAPSRLQAHAPNQLGMAVRMPLPSSVPVPALSPVALQHSPMTASPSGLPYPQVPWQQQHQQHQHQLQQHQLQRERQKALLLQQQQLAQHLTQQELQYQLQRKTQQVEREHVLQLQLQRQLQREREHEQHVQPESAKQLTQQLAQRPLLTQPRWMDKARPEHPPAHNLEVQVAVRQKVAAVLEGLVVQLERTQFLQERAAQVERRAIEKDREKLQAQLRREQKKREREVEQQVDACIERMVKRLEKDEALMPCEDGRPYTEHIRKSRQHCYKVRGAPCTEWFRGIVPEPARDTQAEATVRTARAMIKRMQAQAREPAPKLPLSWVAPEKRGRGWNVVCLALSQVDEIPSDLQGYAA